MMPDCLINFDALEFYETGAILVTWLAYPGKNDSDEKRGALHQSLCAWALRARAEVDPDWANAPQAIKPIYAFRDEGLIHRDFRTLGRRLRDRMIAGKMAIAFLKETQSRELPPLPPGIKHLSLNQLSTMVLEELEQEDAGNVESRIWRPSLPVIHLAVATQILMSETARLGHRPLTAADLIYDRTVVEWIIDAGEICKAQLLDSRRLKIDPASLVTLRRS